LQQGGRKNKPIAFNHVHSGYFPQQSRTFSKQIQHYSDHESDDFETFSQTWLNCFERESFSLSNAQNSHLNTFHYFPFCLSNSHNFQVSIQYFFHPTNLNVIVGTSIFKMGGESDEDALFKVIWGEARGESDKGKAAAAWVVKNRASHSGRSIRGEAAKPSQFYGYQHYKGPDEKSESDKKLANKIRQIAKDVLSETISDPTHGATHFHTEEKPPRGACFGNIVKVRDDDGNVEEKFVAVKPHCQIGKHWFFKGIAPYK
jgi:hypothetical protein